MLGSRINGAMLIAARTVDRRLKPEGGYLAERCERQRVKHGPEARLPFAPRRRFSLQVGQRNSMTARLVDVSHQS
jgi:hypothetical protein